MKTRSAPRCRVERTNLHSRRHRRAELRRCLLALAVGAGLIGAASDARANPRPVEQPHIQIAILLDTSGSMEGLIHQARTQLWKIVNEFATAERHGHRPVLQVALYEYGKSSLHAEEGYIRRIVPLTTDLDAISEQLFALTTNGGDEYCGWVIRDAVRDLDWSGSAEDLKAIFIAGNEPFSQGSVDYARSCREAIARGILVNTIHCGAYDQGVSGGWKDAALMADGRYLNIDQDEALVHVPAPQDEEIARLGAALNSTYVPFGLEGASRAARQTAQDANAQKLAPAVAAERAVFKASSHYKNSSWDLVDAVTEGAVDLEALDEALLPEELRAIDPAQRQDVIEERRARRAELQSRIQDLEAERSAYLAQQTQAEGPGDARTFDVAMIEAIREQAAAREFELAR